MLLPVQECGKGVNLDLLPSELAPGVWSDASNMRFRNGFAMRRKGITAAYTTPTDTPYFLTTYNTYTSRFLVQAGLTKVFVDDGSTRTEITPISAPTGTRDDRWTGIDFNGVLVLNNGVNDPMYWNGDVTTDLAAIPGWTVGTKADSMRALKYYLVAIGITKAGTKFPYRVMWSSAAEPGSLPTSWAATATNDAGDRDISGIGILVDALPYGDALVIYGQEGRCLMRWIGGDQVMETQVLPGKDGILARGCVVNTPRGHVFLSNGDIRLHAGGESTSIVEGVARDWLATTIDPSNAGRAFVCLNPQETEVWVCFPSTGQTDCDTVLAWNWKDDTWAKFSVPSLTYGTAGVVSTTLAAQSWSGQTITWNQAANNWNQAADDWSQSVASSNESRLIVSTSTPTIGLANTGALDFGLRVNWYLERRGLALSADGDAVRAIRSIRPRLDATAGSLVTMRLGTTMRPDDTPAFPSSKTYTQGTTNFANLFTTAGRYGAVRMEGADDQPISIRSYQLDVADSGGRF